MYVLISRRFLLSIMYRCPDINLLFVPCFMLLCCFVLFIYITPVTCQWYITWSFLMLSLKSLFYIRKICIYIQLLNVLNVGRNGYCESYYRTLSIVFEPNPVHIMTRHLNNTYFFSFKFIKRFQILTLLKYEKTIKKACLLACQLFYSEIKYRFMRFFSKVSICHVYLDIS